MSVIYISMSMFLLNHYVIDLIYMSRFTAHSHPQGVTWEAFGHASISDALGAL